MWLRRGPDLNIRQEAAAIGHTEHYVDSKQKVEAGRGRLLGRGGTCPDDFGMFTRRETPDKRESQNRRRLREAHLT